MALLVQIQVQGSLRYIVIGKMPDRCIVRASRTKTQTDHHRKFEQTFAGNECVMNEHVNKEDAIALTPVNWHFHLFCSPFFFRRVVMRCPLLFDVLRWLLYPGRRGSRHIFTFHIASDGGKWTIMHTRTVSSQN